MLAGAAPAIAAEVDQSTTGWSSPIQSGNNNVVNCTGVDPRAETYLNDLLDRMKLDLKQKTAEANEWAQLEETKKQHATKGEDATLVQTAQDLLHEGELAKAHAMFDRLIKSDEANVDRAAQDHFGRASVFALQFRLDEALPDYARAYQYRPGDPRFAEAYAHALYQPKDYLKAEQVVQELLRQRRNLAAQNPTAYRPAWQGRSATSGFSIGRCTASLMPRPDPPWSCGMQTPSQPSAASARWNASGNLPSRSRSSQ